MTFGPFILWDALMVINMRKLVTIRDILPGNCSIGIKKLIKEIRTRTPVGRKTFIMNGWSCLLR